MKYVGILLLTFCLLLAPTKVTQANSSESYLDYIQDRTVLVSKKCEDKSKNGWGSGVIIEGNKVLTAEHVIDERENCSIFIRRGKEDKFQALVIKEDAKVDLALLVVAHDYKVNTLTAKSRLGEAIVVVGYPAQLLDRGTPYLSILYGNISTKNVLAKKQNRYVDRISAPIYFGSSGGPAFNSAGQVIGIVSAGHMKVEGYFYTVRGHDIINFLGKD